MWIDATGTHMIMHSQLTDHGTVRGPSEGADHKKKRGGYAFSADGLVRWSLSTWELFPSEIYWSNGTTQQLLKQQRPSLIFDPVTSQVRPTSKANLDESPTPAARLWRTPNSALHTALLAADPSGHWRRLLVRSVLSMVHLLQRMDAHSAVSHRVPRRLGGLRQWLCPVSGIRSSLLRTLCGRHH